MIFKIKMKNAQKIFKLEKKLAEAEEKYKEKLRRFRGIAHESASGELAYSDLKVWEDFVESIKKELEVLKGNKT